MVTTRDMRKEKIELMRIRFIDTREEEWDEFEKIVSSHIVNYANLQYGEKGEDQLTDWTEEQILNQLKKYVIRNLTGQNKRGRIERLRDLLKISHYVCVMFWKEEPSEKEIEQLARGE